MKIFTFFKTKSEMPIIRNEEFLRKEQFINLDKYTKEEIEFMDLLSDFFVGAKGKHTYCPFYLEKLTKEKLLERAAWKESDKDRYIGWLASIVKKEKSHNTTQIYNTRSYIPDIVRFIYARTGEDFRNADEKKDIKKKNTKKNREKSCYKPVV